MLQIFVGSYPGDDGVQKAVTWGGEGFDLAHARTDQPSFLLGTPDLGLPSAVTNILAKQFQDVSRLAPRHFWSGHNDEDTLTGSFGATLANVVQGNALDYTWSTSAKKLRGRGKGAAEKGLGADMAVEIEVDHHGVRTLKTLLVQAKKEWIGTDRKLKAQAECLAKLPGGGLVLDYRHTGYRAVSAHTAAAAGGNSLQVPENGFRDIGDVLGGEFLACTAGSTSLYYSITLDRLYIVEGDVLRQEPCMIGHVSRTTVNGPPP
jgi:hypothetical protein